MRYIGSKLNLLPQIARVIDRHIPRADSFCDLFSGSAAVARYFKPRYRIFSNDQLYFSYCLQAATIEMPAPPVFSVLRREAGIEDPIDFFTGLSPDTLESLPRERRFFQNHYAPRGGRMYLTDENALRIDYIRNTIDSWRDREWITRLEYLYLVAAVVEGIPSVSNISGTYGAYHKRWDRRTAKPFAPVRLPVTENGRDNRCFQTDGAGLLRQLTGDILYLDPPYNARQYLTNYHVLETAARYDFPTLHGVTGQRDDTGPRSRFCSKKTAPAALEELLSAARFRYILLSYSTDGLMDPGEIRALMERYARPGSVEVTEIPYRRFRSRAGEEKGPELAELIFYMEKEI